MNNVLAVVLGLGSVLEKVLLIDDEEMIRTTAKRMISAVGCDVILADIRVLISTGHGQRRDTEKMINNGAQGVIRKPFGVEQLSAAIDQALDQEP